MSIGSVLLGSTRAAWDAEGVPTAEPAAERAGLCASTGTGDSSSGSGVLLASGVPLALLRGGGMVAAACCRLRRSRAKRPGWVGD